ncbi:glycosyl transferase [Luteibacter sp. dw_328]|uniref:LpxL/LpxP family acyltransferase n=1 Tax=Luteibacter sp. dw_328 TaxID=2719796 RepID=UPI001BD30348|nr:glycosyl transferase [Luteibacter sp. dw_328]
MPESADATTHWASRKERGSFLGMKLTSVAVRLLGRRPVAPVIYLIVLYFFVTGRATRRIVGDYQRRLAAWSGRADLFPRQRPVLAQYLAFGDCMLDRFDVWRGKLRLSSVDMDDPDGVRDSLRSGGRGQLLVCTHLGNLDVCRAMAEIGEGVALNVLMHLPHAAHFNRLLGESGDRRLRLMHVGDLDTVAMMDLSQRLERGEWVAIAGDRVPEHGGRSVNVDFLGAPAAFPQGPWLMAAMLRCPVNLVCCIKHAGRYTIHLRRFDDASTWERSTRGAAIAGAVSRYAEWLAQHCLAAPLQWFNFHPYWHGTNGAHDAR